MYRPPDDHPDDDNPRAFFARQDAEDEARWQQRCEAAVERLLSGLRPDDGSRFLFTFAEQKRFNLKRRRADPRAR
jgi:hypothetical protein